MKKILDWLDDHYQQLVIILALLVILLSLLLLFGCRTTKLTEAQKASIARNEEIKRLKDTRVAFPCDTTITIVVKKDTTIVRHVDSTGRITDTFKITQYRDKIIIDRASERLKSDSISELLYQVSSSRDEYNKLAAETDKAKKEAQEKIKALNDNISKLKPWKSTVITAAIAIAFMLGVGVFLKIKNFI